MIDIVGLRCVLLDKMKPLSMSKSTYSDWGLPLLHRWIFASAGGLFPNDSCTLKK